MSALPASERKLRWGFMGAASIASKNFHAVKGSARNEIVAIASRSEEKARSWAAERGIPKAYGSYEALLADPDIDAVYIPLPTTLHVEWVSKAAAAGKHVLVEKPVAVTLPDAQAMIAACRAANVVFMDGLMFQHHTRTARLVSELRSGTIGDLRRIDSGFSFSGDADFLSGNIRVKASADPLGCVGDLGWYNCRFALCAFDEVPTHVTAVCHAATPEGVPLDTSTILHYKGDARAATFSNSFRTAFRQWAEVAGTSGTLRLDDFVIPRSPAAAEYTLSQEAGPVDDHRRIDDKITKVQVMGCVQESQMFDDFATLVLDAPAAGARHPDCALWEGRTLQTQAMVEAIMTSIKAGGARVPVPAVEL